MKTLVVGAGIIGVIYGWALAEAGVDVTHLVRKGRQAKFAGGVELDVLDERKGHPPKNLARYAIQCVEAISPADGYELIIVPTNAHQLEAALQELAPLSGQALFLIFTGNWGGPEVIDRYLPRERYVLGYADGGGTVRAGVYWTNLGGEVHLGEAGGPATENLEKVTALFARAGIRADVQPNMMHWLWQHQAGTIGFSAGFAKHGEIQAYLADTNLLKECVLATRELYDLCRRRGVDMRQYPEAGFIGWPLWLVVAMLRWNFKRNESMQRFTAHAASRGSLRETKAYYAGVLKTAEELGAPVPHTRALGEYLKNVT